MPLTSDRLDELKIALTDLLIYGLREDEDDLREYLRLLENVDSTNEGELLTAIGAHIRHLLAGFEAKAQEGGKVAKKRVKICVRILAYTPNDGN